jgi:glutaminyl-peptide cyclotransferase
VAWVAACGPPLGATGARADGPALRSSPPRQDSGEPPARRLRVEILGVFPHDGRAFTQGLLWYDGSLYESTGLQGASSVRQVDRSGEVVRMVSLDPRIFGEGLARVDDRLYQITWQQGLAIVYDLATFEKLREFGYSGEGWGLCYDGERLVMSDGSSNLFLRDPQTFDLLGTIPVTLDGQPIDRLNELECVGDFVYANVWMTDNILRIDERSGRVDATIDASGLLTREERLGADVLNGIAFDPDRDTFLITGKFWPKLFEVRFVE